ncbi:MAG: type IX secretion system protein PorQ [Flavobacteriales bacterium]|nr:type IX secretion system protein PorQ [Flavobacteriales bacterium]
MVKRSLLLFFICAAFSTNAQTNGSTVFNSLNIPSSARVASVGGSLLAVRDGDLNLALYNPSLLDSTSDGQVALSYVNYFSNINLGFAAYAHHFDSLGLTMSATMQYVDYGKITQRDLSGANIGTFQAGDYALIIGAAMPIDSNFTIGANLKGIYSTLAGYTSVGAAVDLSATYYNAKRKFTAAAVFSNFGYQLKGYTADVRDTLPTNFQIGITKQLKHAPFRFSIVFDQLNQWDNSFYSNNSNQTIDPITGEVSSGKSWEFGDKLMRHVIVGTEVLLGENFAVRLGYNYRRRQEMKLSDRPGTAGLSWGLGFKIKKFQLSYGRATYHFAGPSNNFTVTTRLADWR